MTISVTAAKTSVLANGTNSVQIHFEGAAKAPVSVQTQRGFFGSSTTAQVDATAGDVLLVTCDATTSTSCAGDDTITVTDAALNTGRLTVQFLGLDQCTSSCGFDAACANHACTSSTGAQGTCSATTPSACVVAVCAPAQSVETSCSDGIDNDCNGKIDCADSACDGKPCKAGATDWACKSGVCTQATPTAGVTYGLQVSPSRTRIPANGTKVPVTITVLADSQPAAGVPLTLSASAGSTVSPATTQTGADGTVTVQLTGPTTPGIATITAKLTATPTISLSASVYAPAIGSLTFGATTFGVMGVKMSSLETDSGYNQTNPLSVEVLDDEGKPYPDGLAVTFQHSALQGSSLTPGGLTTSPAAACTSAAGVYTCVAVTASPTDKPDTTGLATITLNPGTASGTLVVTASAIVNGVTKSFTFPGIPVIGWRASAANFSIVCSPRNVPALADTNCSTSNVDAHFTCKAILKDRFGNLVGVPTPVLFHAEAASIGPQTAVTAALDPTKDPSAQPDLGSAIQIFNTLGGSLPWDVPPHDDADPSAYEPRATWSFDPCDASPATPTRVHNPRDGVVAVIAVTDGEDAFTDLNGNGVYDVGEPYVTQGEPFIDANDNGVRDDVDPFKEWYLDVNGNGQYDGPVATAAWRGLGKIWTQTVVVFTGQPMTMPVPVLLPTVPPTPSTYYLGTRWVAGSAAAACTATPSASFAVKAGTPPTSQAFVVVASDGNLNRLASAATYGVAAVPPATVTPTYDGLASYADELGFFFRYWPCDSTGANCASRCTATGSALPCMMQPAVFAYSCGISADTAITGGSQPDSGIDSVNWNVTLPYPVYSGSTVTAIDKLPIHGTSN